MKFVEEMPVLTREEAANQRMAAAAVLEVRMTREWLEIQPIRSEIGIYDTTNHQQDIIHQEDRGIIHQTRDIVRPEIIDNRNHITIEDTARTEIIIEETARFETIEGIVHSGTIIIIEDTMINEAITRETAETLLEEQTVEIQGETNTMVSNEAI
mgnify:CR=1 FL=1